MVFALESIHSVFLASRFCSIFVGIAAAACVIGAAIAIGVIVGKESDAFRKKVFTNHMSIGLSRPITRNELDQFYDKYETLTDLDRSVNKAMEENFSDSHVKTIIVFLVDKPIVVSPQSSRRKAQQERPSIVVLNATSFFKTNVSGSQVRRAMMNYSEWITLVTIDGKPSSWPSPILLNQSIFTDATPANLTEEEARKQASVSYNRSTTTTTIASSTENPDRTEAPTNSTTTSTGTTADVTTITTVTASPSSPTSRSTAPSAECVNNSASVEPSVSLVSNCSALYESPMAIVFQYSVANNGTNLSTYETYLWYQLKILVQNRLATIFPATFVKLEALGSPSRIHLDAIEPSFMNSTDSIVPMTYTFLSVSYFNSDVTANAIKDCLINTTISLALFNGNQTNASTARFAPEASVFDIPRLGKNRTMMIEQLRNACQSLKLPTNTNRQSTACQTNRSGSCQSFYRYYFSTRITGVYHTNDSMSVTEFYNYANSAILSFISTMLSNTTQSFVWIGSWLFSAGLTRNLIRDNTAVFIAIRITRLYTNFPMPTSDLSSNTFNLLNITSLPQNFSFIGVESFAEYSGTFNMDDPC